MSLHPISPKTQLVEYQSGLSFEVKFCGCVPARAARVLASEKEEFLCWICGGKPDLLWGTLIFWRTLRFGAVILPGLNFK